jgi:hypothetical protein
VPDLSTLFAVRGDRFLTVSYAVSGRPLPRRLAAAAAVTREAFLLSARRHG